MYVSGWRDVLHPISSWVEHWICCKENLIALEVGRWERDLEITKVTGHKCVSYGRWILLHAWIFVLLRIIMFGFKLRMRIGRGWLAFTEESEGIWRPHYPGEIERSQWVWWWKDPPTAYTFPCAPPPQPCHCGKDLAKNSSQGAGVEFTFSSGKYAMFISLLKGITSSMKSTWLTKASEGTC